MGLFSKTTRFFRGGLSEEMRLLPKPCTPGWGSHVVSIKIFDRKGLLGDANLSAGQLKQELESFFDQVKEAAAEISEISPILNAFTFQVTYFDRDSTTQERNEFRVMDFPIYLESMEGASRFTYTDAEERLSTHGIPQKLSVFRYNPSIKKIVPATITDRDGINSVYGHVKDFLENDTSLGIGVPGAYYVPGHQYICRKIGFIKVDKIVHFVPHARRASKLIKVFQHEIGHMMGLAHDGDTLMDVKYEKNENYPMYSELQLHVISETLTRMSQS